MGQAKSRMAQAIVEYKKVAEERDNLLTVVVAATLGGDITVPASAVKEVLAMRARGEYVGVEIRRDEGNMGLVIKRGTRSNDLSMP